MHVDLLEVDLLQADLLEARLLEAGPSGAGFPVSNADADAIAGRAVAALVAEATLTPKPGLVDRRGPGAHADVELATLLASAEALRPTFAEIARASAGRWPSPELREDLARIGRDGERRMFAVTGGANTHRGAIWALGLLAAARVLEGAGGSVETVCATAGRIARHADRFAPPRATNGARACRAYGVSGARGEADAGFPHVRLAVATLRARRAAGAAEDHARLDALLSVMARLDDTCLLHRGGRRALRVARLGARAVLGTGGAATAEGQGALLALDRRLLALNASPGGVADMLAAALFLDGVPEHRSPAPLQAQREM
ncbi:triphosphoribosyl-dephospho-CoA synthase [Starkeya sp. 3C]|uniref:Probable 2-(5''-triphosphoribosyl)-3'-dephosphocoenzyme-A synthase n=1 Tax=Ancylobacter moscoviensis TaxID=2597768 RepID=A0ABY3DLW1_9HYPH|nr:triphosphoribosyl-dephospho-CoA synthase [Ancylobacter moscoviensis]TSJ60244.1 triphosphoribosyl-dephospho-CoA synthase [Ancylobacter moscoviensis]